MIKKLLPLCLMLLIGCTKSDVELTLQKYVEDMAQGTNVKYRLQSFEIINQITNNDMIDSLMNTLPFSKIKPTIEEFTTLRNQEFIDFRYTDKNYEEKVMRGEFKDQSEWCTVIRLITESADSLICNWDKVDRFSYDLNRLIWWYNLRASQYYKIPASYTELQYTTIINSKEQFEVFDSLQNCNKEEIYMYIVDHKYSIYNPLIKSRVDLNNHVRLDKNKFYISHESKTSIGDILELI